MLCLLDASKVDDALALVTDLSDTLEDRTLEVRLHVTFVFIFSARQLGKKGPARAFLCDAEMLRRIPLKVRAISAKINY